MTPADRLAAQCPCGASVTVAPCEGCGRPLRIGGSVFGVCARPDCDDQVHVSRNPVRVVSPTDPDLRAALRGLLDYRAHRVGCEVETTDFCTCGMKEAADAARAALQDSPEHPDPLPHIRAFANEEVSLARLAELLGTNIADVQFLRPLCPGIYRRGEAEKL